MENEYVWIWLIWGPFNINFGYFLPYIVWWHPVTSLLSFLAMWIDLYESIQLKPQNYNVDQLVGGWNIVFKTISFSYIVKCPWSRWRHFYQIWSFGLISSWIERVSIQLNHDWISSILSRLCNRSTEMANINLTFNIIQIIQTVLQLFQLIAAYQRARRKWRWQMKILKLLRLMGTYRYTRNRRDVWTHLS